MILNKLGLLLFPKFIKDILIVLLRKQTMQNLTNRRKYLLLVFFLFFSLSIFAGNPAPVSFLPLGDSYSTSRNSEYGATIENVKPFRQAMPMEDTETVHRSFGSTDIFICIILFGIYIVFAQKKSKSRNAGL